MIPAYPGVTNREKTEDAACYKSDSKFGFSFDEKPRKLELRLVQTRTDQANDLLENLLMPLDVLLIERFEEKKVDYECEDVFYFTWDGDFLSHGWRVKSSEDSDDQTEDNKFTYDADRSKLFRYGEQIQKMIGDHEFHPTLENHPTVKRLKTHTLWKLEEPKQASQHSH